MPRRLFGGSTSDYAMERVGNQLLVRPGATGAVWTAATGGTQLTDLTDLDGTPITTVTADGDGAVAFYGPDGVTNVFMDFGYGRRYAAAAVDLGQILQEHLAERDQPGGWPSLDSGGRINPSQVSGALDWQTVAAHGAVGDGAADDTPAILAAIAACPVGGVVYFPAGVYRITETLDLPMGITLLGSHSNLMVGPGMTDEDSACWIQPAPAFDGDCVIQIIGDDDGAHPDINGEQRLRNLMIDGSQLTGSSIDGIFAKGNVQNVVLDDVCIRQMPNNGIVTASRTDGVFPFSWRLRHVMVDNCHANGLLINGNTDITLDDVQVIGCWAQGIVLTNCTNAQLLACRTEWNGSHGYRITGAWGDWQGSGGMQMTGCSTDRNGQHGVFVDATGNTPILITGLMTRRDGRNGGTGGSGFAGLAVVGATVPVTVNGVTCYPGVDDGGGSTNSPQYGVRLSGASTVLLDDAYLHAASAGLFDDGTNGTVRLGSSITTARGATTVAARIARPRSAGELGVYVPDGWGKFWRAKRDAAESGKARIIAVGDSVTKGYYCSDLVTKNYVGILRTALQSAYGDGGSGLFSVNRTPAIIGAKPEAIAAWQANGSIATTTGTWTDTVLWYGPGISSIYATAAATATFTVRGSTLKIYTLAGVNTPNAGYTYSIDGAAAVAVADPGLSSASVRTQTVTGLSAGTHTVVISYNGSGGSRLQLIGVAGERDTGVIVDNAGRSGAQTSHYFVAGTGNTLWHGGTSQPADLVIYALGLNDANQNVTLDAWAANVYSTLNTIKGTGTGATDLLLVMQHRGNFAGTIYSQYGARMRGIAEEYGAALVNLWPMGQNNYAYWQGLGYWGDQANPGAAGSSDLVHLSDAGHAYVASKLLPLLMT
ncbi:glycosyl hydrolase family 28-related protein [Streptomyces rubiginosohelvolus]|uniref:glycosyl hydrolase family 28-related protein n=1 Tax=Streptomyces rubiginosohelvolus TaxID=67362 RepID=UPI0037874C66